MFFILSRPRSMLPNTFLLLLGVSLSLRPLSMERDGDRGLLAAPAPAVAL